MPRSKKAAISGIAGLDLLSLGVPTRTEVLNMYCQHRTNNNSNPTITLEEIKNWNGFYLAFVAFKNAVIVQGVAQRAKAGIASSARAGEVAKALPMICMISQSILDVEVEPILLQNQTTRRNMTSHLWLDGLSSSTEYGWN